MRPTHTFITTLKPESIPSQRIDAYTRLITRLKLEPVAGGAEKGLLTKIQPVTDFDALLRVARINQELVSVTATAIYNLCTIPLGKVHWLHGIFVSCDTGVVVTEISLFDGTYYFGLATGTGLTLGFYFGSPFPMRQQWSIAVGATRTTTQNLRCRTLIEEEDAF
jgi:hypothetical protein